MVRKALRCAGQTMLASFAAHGTKLPDPAAQNPSDDLTAALVSHNYDFLPPQKYEDWPGQNDKMTINCKAGYKTPAGDSSFALTCVRAANDAAPSFQFDGAAWDPTKTSCDAAHATVVV